MSEEPVSPTISADTRAAIPREADERTQLIAFLDRYRETVVLKVRGLTLEQATRRLVPSETTLLGMIKHLAVVEGYWFRSVLHDETLDVPYSAEDPDADFRIEREETVESVLASYREAIAASRRAIERVSLDTVSKRGTPLRANLRYILIHMIEESARHAGQADIIREQTDGATGN
jgi:uncharacterized damage-inducible protein DinB